MQFGKFNVVIDAQWGSCGKGLIASYLAQTYKVEAASTNNLPNAGHTAVLGDGSKFVSKILPVSSFLNMVGQDVKAYIGPGAGFFLDQLFKEMAECGLAPEDVRIHPRAMVVTTEHAALERGEKEAQGTKHIASTMQGSGAVQAEKLMRGSTVRLARDFPELESMITDNWLEETHGILDGSMWLHEGSQGFSLGVNHGSHYPQCTSRECTTSRELMDMGFAPQQIGDVYAVLRPYPIRVGNVIEDGQQVGYSGDCYSDQHELTWVDIKKRAKYPADYDLKEMTTVTKRLRRVFSFSMDQIRLACMVNGATKLALNFANYLDYSCFGTRGDDISQLPDAVRGFIDELETSLNLPVTIVGTGPSVDHVWEFNR
jgi:adenylosuccinate synthase